MAQRFLINQALVQAQIDLIKQYEEDRHTLETKTCPMCKLHNKIINRILDNNGMLIDHTTYLDCTKCINAAFTSYNAGCVIRLVNAQRSIIMYPYEKEKMLHYHNLVLQWMYKNAGKWLSIDDLQILKDFDVEAYYLHGEFLNKTK